MSLRTKKKSLKAMLRSAEQRVADLEDAAQEASTVHAAAILEATQSAAHLQVTFQLDAALESTFDCHFVLAGFGVKPSRAVGIQPS